LWAAVKVYKLSAHQMSHKGAGLRLGVNKIFANKTYRQYSRKTENSQAGIDASITKL
jgi:hypothetical protein